MVTFFNPACRMIRWPTARLPVNVILATRGSATSASPTSSPGPGRQLMAPSGIPAWAKALASIRPDNGVAEAGLRITGQPAATAGPSLCAARFSGKLNGEMAADHADRPPHDHARVVHAGRVGVHPDQLAAQRPGLVGREDDRLDGSVGLDLGGRKRLPGLLRDRPGELLAALAQEPGDAVEHRRPLVRRDRLLHRARGGVIARSASARPP